MSFHPSASGLLLPPRLAARRPANAGTQEDVWTLPGGREVRRRAVHQGARGWRHEVTATFVTRESSGEAVQMTDAVWFDVEDQAVRLARAAADRLQRSPELAAGGLSTLARQLGLRAAAS